MDDASPGDFTIDGLCLEFEAEFESGLRPSLEAYLANIVGSQRRKLFSELLQIELRWNQSETQPPSASEYRVRFPEFSEAIDAGFSSFRSADSGGHRDGLEKTADLRDSVTGPDFSLAADPFAGLDPLATFDPELTQLHSPVADNSSLAGEPRTSLLPTVEAVLEGEGRDRLKHVRRSFSEAWRLGPGEPQLEEYVPNDIEPGERLALIHELVLVDIRHRRDNNKGLPQEAYHTRFPDCRIAIERAFSRVRSGGASLVGEETIPTSQAADRSRAPVIRANDPTSRYRAMKLHARGGLGAVFRAEDKELKRVVALKEILPEHSGNLRYRERFVFEAEVTGSLEHPGIVPVYGLGRYADNQPYYAMRFIRGISFRKAVVDFHSSNSRHPAGIYYTRDFRSLLRRLIETCNAIHYAHEHGVIHRDIKPDNIMLGDFGETLVVDWGLAKLVAKKSFTPDLDSIDKTLSIPGSGSQSRYGSAVGTPMYMSPEQAFGRHDELDGRTDVYSLGAMLFNIVSGGHPVDGNSAGEIVSKVRSGKIKKLESISSNAPRALASICAKAMAFDRDNRYATALELADDIDRWLSDEPVVAHHGRESLFERAGRLIRRYRSWTVSGALALLSVALIAITAAVLINGAKQKESLARQQATKFKGEALARYHDSLDAIDTWLVQSSDALEYFPGTQPVRRQLLQFAVDDYEKLALRKSSDPELELERGRAMLRLGDLAQLQENYAAARSYYQESLSIFAADIADEQIALSFATERGSTQARIGSAFAAEDQDAEAEAAFEKAIVSLSSTANETSDPLPRRYLAAAYVNQGELFTKLQRYDKAEASLQQALQQYAALKVDSDEKVALGIARNRELLGRLYTQTGDHGKALGYFEAAIQGLSPLVKDQPDHPEFLDAIASASISQATSFRTLGFASEQLGALQSSISHYRDLCAALPDTPRYEENLAITLIDLGLTQHEAGNNGEAESALQEAQQILTKLATTFSQIPRFREELAGCWDALGQVQLDFNQDPSEAVETLADAIAVYQALLQGQDARADYIERVAIAQSHYARALWRKGDGDSARQGFEAAISAIQDLIDLVDDLPKYSSALAHVHEHYALMLSEFKDEGAVKQFEMARDRWTMLDHQRTGSDASDLAWLLATCPIEGVRDMLAAERFSGEAVKLAPNNADFWSTHAFTELQSGDIAAASRDLQQAKSLRGDTVDRDFFVDAMIQRASGNTEAAEQSLRSGVEWMEAHRPHNLDLQALRKLAEASRGE